MAIVAIDKLMYEESDTGHGVKAFTSDVLINILTSVWQVFTAKYSQWQEKAIQNYYRCLNEFKGL